MPTDSSPPPAPATATREAAVATSALVRVRTTCRSCGSPALRDIVSLGNHYVSNFVTDDTEGARAPLDLVLCDPTAGGCGLLQLRHTVEAGFLYRNYWYRSGVNHTMREALADIARAAERLVPLRPGDRVIDIGSNDGTLLRVFRTPDLVRIGFEPATNLMPYAQERGTVTVNDFFAFEHFRALFGADARANVITSIAMFYDLEDPNAFVADVARCLAPGGVWIIQMSYLPLMLAQNAFDNVCHEHLEFYTLGSLRALLTRHRLRVLDVELNDVNGGSFRIYVAHAGSPVEPFPGADSRIRAREDEERDLALHTRAPYEAFAERVARVRDEVTLFIRQAVARGKVVDVYGASTKGNTLLQYFGLDHALIRWAAERNSDKWGKRTVGTRIPIVSEEQVRGEPPDYFLVLPWHFLREFEQRERAFLEAGGKFIVPLPTFRIVELPKKFSNDGRNRRSLSAE